MRKILFLGYDSKKTKLISFLKKKKYKVFIHRNKKLDIKIVKNYDNIISFGYRKIIDNKIISLLKNPVINLHISYLPYNRGSHPNYWSFVKKTQKGVTIHEMTHEVDRGKILFQKKIFFKIDSRLTFEKTYRILVNEIEKLFIKNYSEIINFKYKGKIINKKGSINFKKDLPKNFKWDVVIKNHLTDLANQKN